MEPRTPNSDTSKPAVPAVEAPSGAGVISAVGLRSARNRCDGNEQPPFACLVDLAVELSSPVTQDDLIEAIGVELALDLDGVRPDGHDCCRQQSPDPVATTCPISPAPGGSSTSRPSEALRERQLVRLPETDQVVDEHRIRYPLQNELAGLAPGARHGPECLEGVR